MAARVHAHPLSGSRRTAAYVALLSAVTLFSIGSIHTGSRIEEAQRLVSARVHAAQWLVVSLERELLKLLPMVARLERQPEKGDVEAALVQYEVLWSRVKVLQQGSESAPLRDLDEYWPSTREFEDALVAVEPAFEALKQNSTALPPWVHERLAALERPAHDLVVATHLYNSWHSDFARNQLTKNRLRLYASSAGIVAAVLVLFLLLFKQVRASRRLNEELERRVAERTAALRRSEARYREVVEDQTELVCRYLPDRTLTFVNEAYCRYFGKRRDELEGHRFIPTIPEEDRAMVANEVDSLGPQNSVVTYEHRVVVPGGETRWQQWTERAIVDGGRVVECQAVGRDVTERKQAEAALASAQDRLRRREKLELLGQLTGTVSHELRNPLGTLRTSIAGLRKLTEKSDARVGKLLEIADRNVTRCNNIIADLLDYAGTHELEPKPTVLDDWLTELLESYELPPGIELRTDLRFDATVAFDPERLRRAVINVLDNACHAMAEDGEAEPPKHRSLRIATCRTHSRVEIRVRDTGKGIPEQQLDQVFEPLYSTKSFGVGLGLPIVRQLMMQHGGGIRIDSREDEGTEVLLWLPLARESAEAA